MAKSKKVESAGPYARRLLEDEYVQEQLRRAAAGFRVAYERVRRERGQATEDKRFYRSLQQAATSTREAIVALRRPEPEPKRGRSGRIMLVVLVIGGTAWLTVKLHKHQSDSSSVPTVSPTAVEAPTGVGAAPQPVSEPEHSATSIPPIA